MSGWGAILIRSACEAPLRGAGVRAVVPAAPGPRGPGARAGARDGQAARTGDEWRERDGPRAVPRPMLVATSFFPRPFGVGSRRGEGGLRAAGPGVGPFLKGLILAQNERWRRGLGMQVERV